MQYSIIIGILLFFSSHSFGMRNNEDLKQPEIEFVKSIYNDEEVRDKYLLYEFLQLLWERVQSLDRENEILVEKYRKAEPEKKLNIAKELFNSMFAQIFIQKASIRDTLESDDCFEKLLRSLVQEYAKKREKFIVLYVPSPLEGSTLLKDFVLDSKYFEPFDSELTVKNLKNKIKKSHCNFRSALSALEYDTRNLALQQFCEIQVHKNSQDFLLQESPPIKAPLLKKNSEKFGGLLKRRKQRKK